VAFGPDGRTIVSGHFDGTLFMWDARTRELIRGPLQAHRARVTTVAFSGDGQTFASGGWDETVRLWDAVTGRPRGAALRVADSAVASVAFSPDGKLLVAGSISNNPDRLLLMWDGPAGWRDRVCAKVVRNLSRSEWKQHVGDIPYIEPCPGLPVPQD
jgi:WD40 repeat protein